MKEFIVGVIQIIGLLMATILISYVMYLYTKQQCYSQYQAYNATYAIIQGCMVEQNGVRIPAKNLRVISD